MNTVASAKKWLKSLLIAVGVTVFVIASLLAAFLVLGTIFQQFTAPEIIGDAPGNFVCLMNNAGSSGRTYSCSMSELAADTASDFVFLMSFSFLWIIPISLMLTVCIGYLSETPRSSVVLKH